MLYKFISVSIKILTLDFKGEGAGDKTYTFLKNIIQKTPVQVCFALGKRAQVNGKVFRDAGQVVYQLVVARI